LLMYCVYNKNSFKLIIKERNNDAKRRESWRYSNWSKRHRGKILLLV
jgi:hypothetical protein